MRRFAIFSLLTLTLAATQQWREIPMIVQDVEGVSPPKYIFIDTDGLANLSDLEFLYVFKDGVMKDNHGYLGLDTEQQLCMGFGESVPFENGYFRYNDDPVFELCTDYIIRYNSGCQILKHIKITIP
ncbi:hypothetical protein METBIDRAFT_82055 [Metschnikowia bicuspidata var. bicuspidata NRRL YB-4993]|uniref:Uncharacterized protein n=1 Tax=Metschnikowia bicuspidata var. bicuspidata NRRL YB-4993 TaxID=869754 RepID=A0A1A0HDL6_9ASCO|nr:hypothetical protein METBIDRAFT_82055 [Metschnikowia bicuspidata var. bicuspidata NRRL YB-4993]OBA22018.1 hypothetical protein METBIDRAFT_82055 [Metschnikowia bicuspidata var. bicuspidata NRRL YB-4993]